MRHDRACSLLLAAACPLPADSYAHWTQYQRITHELIAPDRIELRAECEHQEEHRFLFDWCTWLVDEVRSAAVLMANAPRHSSWRPPHIALGDGTAGETITIRPARSATYMPRKWQFELDASSVFQRLIRDVYDEPEAFLRELTTVCAPLAWLQAVRKRACADRSL
jgi:molecular chaperone HtpG